MGGKQDARRQHVGVAKLIVNNNPQTMKLRPRPRPTLEGCGRSVCDVTLAARNKKARDGVLPGPVGAALVSTFFWKILVTRVNWKCAARRNYRLAGAIPDLG